MSASINISSGTRRTTARRTRLLGQGGFMGGPKRVRRQFRQQPRPITAIVRRIVQRTGEKKFNDTSLATTTTAAWAILTQNLIAPVAGDLVERRIGDRIRITSINFRMFLSMNALEAQAAPSPMITCRIIVGINHQGGTTVTTDVVDTGSTSQLLSWYQNSTISDFTILKDFMIRVDPHALNEGSPNAFAHGTSISEVIKWSHTFKNPLELRQAAGATGVTKNSFFIMAVSTASGAVQNIETRIRYTDS